MMVQGPHLVRYYCRKKASCIKYQIFTIFFRCSYALWLDMLPQMRACIFALNPTEQWPLCWCPRQTLEIVTTYGIIYQN